jgi:rhodanese-related sulfurtransferase
MSRPTRRYHIPSAVRPSPVRIDVDRARELVDQGAVLVDVRRKSQDPPAPDDAIRIPPDEIPESLDQFQRDTPIVLACT